MDKSQLMQSFQLGSEIIPEPDFPLAAPGTPAAILVPILERETLSVLLTKRASHLKHHPGQVSFPGGRYEKSDVSLAQTALRESREEIGLKEEQVSIFGRLPLYRTISFYEITPFVGLVSEPFEWLPDDNEVDEVFEVPLPFLLDESNYHIETISRGNETRQVYFIFWRGHTIWGATASILKTLSNHLNKNKF
ncbi:CoA pyrophosphatase [Alteromonadaceae bacterium M269]|nr:CoA pyrophosphatase [Alteromonadaceae bacterium M269]